MSIKNIVGSFAILADATHRYSSYDYCYNYFYKNDNNITHDMEKSCAILGFYLASWGMMRGSSFLLQKSYKYLQPLIDYIAQQPESVWDIDVDTYQNNYNTILNIYRKIKDLLIPMDKRHLVLVTKVMMGVFGIVPAFDEYFSKTFREISPSKSKFRTFNQASLDVIHKFYLNHKAEIDELAESTFTIDFSSGKQKHNYTKAKIIDMYGFNMGITNILLVGNGINIHFTGESYSNKEIVSRAKEKIKASNRSYKTDERNIDDFFELLHHEVENILLNEYDSYTSTCSEKNSLIAFKDRYTNLSFPINDYDISLEDYFLIYELFCRKQKVTNPQLFDVRELLKRFFIEGIFNDGKIQLIHQKYSNKFKNFLLSFNEIFTTNYDMNIQESTNKTVYHLHGAFHQLDPVYNPQSNLNKMRAKTDVTVPPVGEEYLYSTALSSYSGSIKEYEMTMMDKSNSALEKFAVAGLKNSNLASEYKEWASSDNEITKNLGKSILYIMENKGSELEVLYPITKFKEIFGELTILGLSPFNDNHIFLMINNNDELLKITYYYFTEDEKNKVQELLSNKKIDLKDVRLFWNKVSK